MLILIHHTHQSSVIFFIITYLFLLLLLPNPTSAKPGDQSKGYLPSRKSIAMSTSRTTTKTNTTVGSIPITGGPTGQPPAPTRPMTLNASDEKHELELQLECTRERMRKLKEKRKAEEEAKKRAEEEAARRAAEEE
ncbi:hypothetical protein EV368DRAFT_82535 [Lentinula lateritia]|nr:hypothetical protein EV368DRAFT_82535 [Lentinula lateritia]